MSNSPSDRATSRATRREPFADSPAVGSRGLRTHQLILDAALEAFGESGYARTTMDRIADLAGCSRIAIYQYVSGKDELFERLSAQAATQMWAAMEALGPITPDAGGHASLHTFITRLADVEVRYEPIVRAFEAVGARDTSMAAGAASILERGVSLVEARLGGAVVAPRMLDPTVELLNTGIVSALCRVSTLRAAAPEDYGRQRVDLALADVAHRMLFGVLPDVNVHAPPVARPAPRLSLSDEADALFVRARALDADSTNPRKRALRSMLEVAPELAVERGFRGLRIEDIIRAAGVSRGSFYSYFDDIEDYVRVVGAQAIHEMSVVVDELPESAAPRTLRPWLARHAEVNRRSGALVRIWIEAAEGPTSGDRAAVVDRSRSRLAALLRTRALGDVDVDAAILLAFIEIYGSRTRSRAELDAEVAAIERAFLSS